MPDPYDPMQRALMQQYLADASQGADMDPYTQQLLSTMFQYPVTAKGVPKNYDVAVQNTFQNSLQDRQQTLFDPGNAAMTGGLSPSAFNPIVDEKQLDFPETGTLSVLAQSNGLEGTLAGLIMGDPANGIRGQSASQAMLTIKDMIAHPAENNITDAEAKSLQAALPTNLDNITGAPIGDGVDWNGVTKMAEGLAKPFLAEQGIKARAQDPSSGVIERNGKFFQTNETPSPMTQWLQKQGLDNPNQQYDADYLRQTNQDFGGIESALGQGMSSLDAARTTYAANDAERARQAALASKFGAQDQAAMDRFGRGVQNGLQDYYGQINQDMLTTPAWSGGQHVGDPTVEPMLGQRTPTQNARDAKLNDAMIFFRNYGAEGRIGATPDSIKQALADYMSNASREPMTNVPGNTGSTMVGGAGRGPGGGSQWTGPGGLSIAEPDNPIINNLPGYINSNREPGVVTPDMQRTSSPNFGAATMPTLPSLPQLSAYGDPNSEQAQRKAMALQLIGKMPMMNRVATQARSKAENAGQVLPQAVRPKAIDGLLRKAAYDQTQAAQIAYAKAMLPAYLAQKAGRTPFQDELLARAQSMRAAGSIG